MRQIFIKTICIGVISIASSIALTCMIGAIVGFPARGVIILLMATVCPLLISCIASYINLLQNLQIKSLLNDLSQIHGALAEQTRRRRPDWPAQQERLHDRGRTSLAV